MGKGDGLQGLLSLEQINAQLSKKYADLHNHLAKTQKEVATVLEQHAAASNSQAETINKLIAEVSYLRTCVVEIQDRTSIMLEAILNSIFAGNVVTTAQFDQLHAAAKDRYALAIAEAQQLAVDSANMEKPENT